MTHRPLYEPTRFDARRYRDENVAFWVPRFVEAASIDGSSVVVDLGCGTGGFTAALGPHAVGVEIDPRLAGYGRATYPHLSLIVPDAATLPLQDGSADVVLASLLFHQVETSRVASEAARVLRPGGRLVIRTVAPDDAADWVPHRWFPTAAEAQRRRMPAISPLSDELHRAGLDVVDVVVVKQRTVIASDAQETFEHELLPRYALSDEEAGQGLARLRAADGESYGRRHTLMVLDRR